MFLFKKKKNSIEPKVEAEVKKMAAPPVKVVDKSTKPIYHDQTLKGGSVRVVQTSPPVVTEHPLNKDEIADSLLVKVDPNPAIENAVDDALIAAVLNPAAAPLSPASPEITTAVVPAGASAESASNNETPKPGAQASPPVEPAAAKLPAESEKKGAAVEDKGNMFSNLFGKADVEEESNLDRFIKSLPDVSIEEVVNEAEEVTTLTNEWSQSQNR